MTYPILRKAAPKPAAVSVGNSVVAEIAYHHILRIVISPTHVAVVHRIVYQVEDPCVPSVPLVSREDLEFCGLAVSAIVVD